MGVPRPRSCVVVSVPGEDAVTRPRAAASIWTARAERQERQIPRYREDSCGEMALNPLQYKGFLVWKKMPIVTRLRFRA